MGQLKIVVISIHGVNKISKDLFRNFLFYLNFLCDHLGSLRSVYFYLTLQTIFLLYHCTDTTIKFKVLYSNKQSYCPWSRSENLADWQFEMFYSWICAIFVVGYRVWCLAAVVLCIKGKMPPNHSKIPELLSWNKLRGRVNIFFSGLHIFRE